MGKDWDNFSGKQKSYDSETARHAANRGPGGGNGNQPYGFSSSSGQPTKKERDTFIAFLREVMTEALRVLKPGGHALIWALPRTSHWTATALEDAGFEVRDKLYHLFGSGFPKSHNISVAIDKHLKAEREVIGKHERKGAAYQRYSSNNLDMGNGKTLDNRNTTINAAYIEKGGYDITAPATPEAQRWQGYGSALKPSVEEWVLCRKPLAESSIAAQVLATGTGGLNIGQTRISGTVPQVKQGGNRQSGFHMAEHESQPHPQGRFPSHLLLSHSVFCQPTSCEPDLCPIAELDRQSGVRKSGLMKAGTFRKEQSMYGQGSGYAVEKDTYGDTGGSSRYFQHFPPDDYTPYRYISKASRAERNAGCEDLPSVVVEDHNLLASQWRDDPRSSKGGYENKPAPPQANTHPTVKSLSLMRWLIRLITPPDGIVLDPFCGSGSTLVACVQEQKHFIGIEQDESYVNIANARIQHAQREQGVTVQTQEYECHESCPVRILGEQSGERKSPASYQRKVTVSVGTEGYGFKDKHAGSIASNYGDTGTAARYFQTFAPDLWTQDMQEAEDVFIAEGGYEDGQGE